MKKTSIFLILAELSVLLTGCAKKAKVEINNINDLNGKIVGCQAGTTGELYVSENLKDAKVKSFKNGIDAALALKTGAVDAIVLDELPSKEIVKKNNDLMIVHDNFIEEEYSIAVKKGNKELLDSINNTIKTIQEDGRYEGLISSFMPIDGNITIPEISILNTQEVVKMGTNAAFPPFEYMQGTDIVGMDIALSKYIANDYGKKLQILDFDFDSLIAALQSNAIDFIASGMTATDERRNYVDFSIPYYLSKQVIIIRK